MWDFQNGCLPDTYNHFRKCPEHVIKKGYESSIWKFGLWSDDGKNDYFNFDKHLKLSDYTNLDNIPNI